MSLDAADLFLATKKLEDPERYAEVCRKYPIQSKHNQQRDQNGISPSMARKINGPSGGVPKEHKREFTDEEWAEVQNAKRMGLRELRLDYIHALQLVESDR
jgi:hypothetical protein